MFRLIDRDKDGFLVLVPGWGFDWRIFSSLNLPFNYLYYCSQRPEDFVFTLEKFFHSHGLSRISLLGWSMGGFESYNFAVKHPEMVENLYLVSVRRKYDTDSLSGIREMLHSNCRAYLMSFYRSCFSPSEKAQYADFKRSLMKDYLETFTCPSLLQSLEWIGNAEIAPSGLGKLRSVKIVHGAEDRIALPEEAMQLADSAALSGLTVLESAGHLPFLRTDFAESLL